MLQRYKIPLNIAWCCTEKMKESIYTVSPRHFLSWQGEKLIIGGAYALGAVPLSFPLVCRAWYLLRSMSIFINRSKMAAFGV